MRATGNSHSGRGQGGGQLERPGRRVGCTLGKDNEGRRLVAGSAICALNRDEIVFRGLQRRRHRPSVAVNALEAGHVGVDKRYERHFGSTEVAEETETDGLDGAHDVPENQALSAAVVGVGVDGPEHLHLGGYSLQRQAAASRGGYPVRRWGQGQSVPLQPELQRAVGGREHYVRGGGIRHRIEVQS